MTTHYLFDWGNTLMIDFKDQAGPMCQWERVEAVQGAAECLEALSESACCCLATNAADSEALEIKQALARAGLDRFISHIFCFRELGILKPSCGFFTSISEHLGIHPTSMIMVGDSLETDVLGAIKCGIPAIWLNSDNKAVPPGITAITCLTDLIQP